MCIKLNSLFDREIKVLYATQVLKQGFNIKTICPNYILKYRNTQSQLYIGAWAKTETVIENNVC